MKIQTGEVSRRDRNLIEKEENYYIIGGVELPREDIIQAAGVLLDNDFNSNPSGPMFPLDNRTDYFNLVIAKKYIEGVLKEKFELNDLGYDQELKAKEDAKVLLELYR